MEKLHFLVHFSLTALQGRSRPPRLEGHYTVLEPCDALQSWFLPRGLVVHCMLLQGVYHFSDMVILCS